MTLSYTTILEWYKAGLYKPYADIDGGKWVAVLMRWIFLNVPPWIRISRAVRDMPLEYSHGGIDRPSLRQEVDTELKQDNLIPRDIRGREVKDRPCDPANSRMWLHKYRSSGAYEYFFSYENMDQTMISGFVRLRLKDDPNDKTDICFPCLVGAALIRELHVYGELVHQNQAKSGRETQHMGIGKRLMLEAEQMAWECGYRKVAVIAGVGVRGYYAKLGYHLEDSYMIKVLIREPKIAKVTTICNVSETGEVNVRFTVSDPDPSPKPEPPHKITPVPRPDMGSEDAIRLGYGDNLEYEPDYEPGLKMAIYLGLANEPKVIEPQSPDISDSDCESDNDDGCIIA
jgi:GNAT superfamily N-acetyltransferase